MPQPDAREQSLAHCAGGVLGFAAHLDRCLDDVLERCLMREEVEALEHEADVATLLGNGRFLVLDELAVVLAIADQLAVDLHHAAVDLLEMVDAAQERRLA